MTPEQLAEIRARAEAATPGPWSWVGAATSTGWEDAEELAHPEGIIATADGGYWFEPPNSDFVAHARTDIPALLDYIEELQAKASYQYRSDIRALCHQMIDVMPDNDLPVQAIAERASFYERAYLQFVIEEPTNA